jgi:hypothetical protein
MSQKPKDKGLGVTPPTLRAEYVTGSGFPMTFGRIDSSATGSHYTDLKIQHMSLPRQTPLLGDSKHNNFMATPPSFRPAACTTHNRYGLGGVAWEDAAKTGRVPENADRDWLGPGRGRAAHKHKMLQDRLKKYSFFVT